MLELKHVFKKFKHRYVVQDVSFAIAPHEIAGLIGSNGAGKTTTIRMIFGEIKPTKGEILYNHENIYQHEHLKKIAYFPDGVNMPKNVTVIGYLRYVAALNNIAEAPDLIATLLQTFGLTQHQEKKFTQLSTGMQKRAMICGCLIKKPQFIVLAEPTSGMDVASKIDVLNIIQKLHTFGIGVVITSHIFEELETLITRLIIIENGRVVHNDNFDSKHEKIKEIYMRYINVAPIDTDAIAQKIAQ